MYTCHARCDVISKGRSQLCIKVSKAVCNILRSGFLNTIDCYVWDYTALVFDFGYGVVY